MALVFALWTAWTSGLAAKEPAKEALGGTAFGKELFRFGREGTSPSQLTRVESIAVDSQGFVYAADRELGRLQRFNPAGKLESVLYLNDRLREIAMDRGGVLYVLDDGGLYRYNPKTWAYLGAVERPKETDFHSVAPRPGGGMIALRGGTFGSKEDILLIDKSGKITRTFPQAIEILSGFHAACLAVDSKGNIYVGDEDERTIHRFGPDGRFIGHFLISADPKEPTIDDFYGMAIDHQDRLWVADRNVAVIFASDGRRLQVLDPLSASGFAIGAQDEMYSAERTQIAKYAAAPVPVEPRQDPTPQKPKRQDFTRLSFKAPETDSKQLALVAVDSQGFVYAGDLAAGHVLIFKPSGGLASHFEIAAPGQPWTGLAVDRGGTVYVVTGNRLYRYDGASGKLLGEVKHPDGPGFFHVAPRPDAGVIASWRNPRRDDLVLVDEKGAIETIHRAAVSGAVGKPVGDVLVAMDGRRNLYAAVPALHAVCLFDFFGKYLNRFGSEGNEPGQFSGALTGVTANGQDQFFVSDAKRVSVFSVKGSFLHDLEARGGLAIDDDDNLFAADGTGVVKVPAEGR